MKIKTKVTYTVIFSGDDIKNIRTKLSYTQQELANKLGVSIDADKSWETGRRNMSQGNAKKFLDLCKDML